ncbi:uncharacterized protein LOC133625154 [Colius striatus]|uniref:uncharacterized protein LOC133625154 n=1 Tax=Colius striatus TaxID=57412 RepID=UPI002B1DEF2B|nr:uncharacterized protein LOC133625154 [Colius striatus]
MLLPGCYRRGAASGGGGAATRRCRRLGRAGKGREGRRGEGPQGCAAPLNSSPVRLSPPAQTWHHAGEWWSQSQVHFRSRSLPKRGREDSWGRGSPGDRGHPEEGIPQECAGMNLISKPENTLQQMNSFTGKASHLLALFTAVLRSPARNQTVPRHQQPRALCVLVFPVPHRSCRLPVGFEKQQVSPFAVSFWPGEFRSAPVSSSRLSTESIKCGIGKGSQIKRVKH